MKQYAPKAAAAGEEFLSQVWKVVDGAGSFEDLERGLAGLVGKEAGPGDFENLLGDLMLSAGLMGRFIESEKRHQG